MNAFAPARDHARVGAAPLPTGAGRYVEGIAPLGALRAVFPRPDVAAGHWTRPRGMLTGHAGRDLLAEADLPGLPARRAAAPAGRAASGSGARRSRPRCRG